MALVSLFRVFVICAILPRAFGSTAEKCVISNELGLMDCSNLDLKEFGEAEKSFPGMKILDLSANRISDPNIPLNAFPDLQVLDLTGNTGLVCQKVRQLPPRIKIRSSCKESPRTCNDFKCGPTDECKLTGNGDPVCVYKTHQEMEVITQSSDESDVNKSIVYSGIGGASTVVFIVLLLTCIIKCRRRGLAARAHYDSKRGTITADMIVLAESQPLPQTSHTDELLSSMSAHASFPPPPPPPQPFRPPVAFTTNDAIL